MRINVKHYLGQSKTGWGNIVWEIKNGNRKDVLNGVYLAALEPKKQLCHDGRRGDKMKVLSANAFVGDASTPQDL